MTTRTTTSYEAQYQRFVLSNKDYGQQFCHMYSQRISQMKEMLSGCIKEWQEKDSKLQLLPHIIDSESQVEEDCIIVGTLYKEMENKPSIIDDYADGGGVGLGKKNIKGVRNFTSDSDSLILEDDSGRAKLKGMENVTGDLVTGVTIAVLGQVGSDGLFHVKDWKSSGETLKSQNDSSNSSSSSSSRSSNEKRSILLVSGLEIGSEDTSLVSVQLLIDFISGRLGGENEKNISKSIVRVIIAGDSMKHVDKNISIDRFSNPTESKKLVQENELQQAHISRKTDTIIAQIAATCPIDIMPGMNDPANFAMPQQPIHSCLLPQSARFSTTGFVTNPYQAKFDNTCVVLGHSGQPIHDMILQVNEYRENDNNDNNEMEIDNNNEGSSNDNKENSDTKKNTKSKSTINLLKKSLQWGHIAPTAPDSLSCYPYLKEDPFVMEDAPDIFFAGNQDQYESDTFTNKIGHTTRIICVPSFKTTHQVVLVDLDTLESTPITFNA